MLVWRGCVVGMEREGHLMGGWSSGAEIGRTGSIVCVLFDLSNT